MTRSKKIFAIFAIVFAVLLGYVVYDISTRTTFPGSAPSAGELKRDSVRVDTTSTDK